MHSNSVVLPLKQIAIHLLVRVSLSSTNYNLTVAEISLRNKDLTLGQLKSKIFDSVEKFFILQMRGSWNV